MLPTEETTSGSCPVASIESFASPPPASLRAHPRGWYRLTEYDKEGFLFHKAIVEIQFRPASAIGFQGICHRYIDEYKAGCWCAGYGARTDVPAPYRFVRSLDDQEISAITKL